MLICRCIFLSIRYTHKTISELRRPAKIAVPSLYVGIAWNVTSFLCSSFLSEKLIKAHVSACACNYFLSNALKPFVSG